jgi:hypothetical protein
MKASNRFARIIHCLSGAPVLLLVLAGILHNPPPAHAIPAFARKYGLPCSACHVGWPMLNNFGLVFKDNGYQLGNDRDSPITRDASYFPIAVRMTPAWHRESATNQVVDATPGDSSVSAGRPITNAGFDLSGIDLWFAGTLYKNISFSVLPSSDETGAFHFENAFVRFDNILGSKWLNLKLGKYELDLPVSEKRMLTLSGDGGFYYIYHFLPYGDINPFGGIGDNQLGIELAGHNANSYTRYAFSLLSSNDGNVDTPYGRTMDYYGNFEQAIPAGSLGYFRVSGFGYVGHSPTYYLTTGGAVIPGTGIGNEPFYRVGGSARWYMDKLDIQTVFLHGYENGYLANGIASNTGPLPAGDRSAQWNGGFVETNYAVTPQLVITGRYEGIRMSQQASESTASNLGDLDAFTVGYRWYPMMYSRAGLAWHQEYSVVKSQGVGNVGGAFAPSFNSQNVTSSSIFMGFDFAF